MLIVSCLHGQLPADLSRYEVLESPLQKQASYANLVSTCIVTTYYKSADIFSSPFSILRSTFLASLLPTLTEMRTILACSLDYLFI